MTTHTKDMKNTGMINLDKQSVDLIYFKNLINVLHNCDEKMCKELLDSYSYTQFESKTKVIEILFNSGILSKKIEVSVFGCWFNSIIASVLYDQVKTIHGFDLDKQVVTIGKRLFKNYDNIHFYNIDIFKNFNSNISKSDLIINTSCEHMPSFNNWRYWKNIKNKTYFLLQSHNLKQLKGHINCVNTLSEFENQMPKSFHVIHSETINEKMRDIKDGKRFTIFGYKNE